MFQDLLQNVMAMPPLPGSRASSGLALEQRLMAIGEEEGVSAQAQAVGSVLVSICFFLSRVWLRLS